jgi:hypothetical protein
MNTYLRNIILIRLTFLKSNGSASTSLPRYVARRSPHLTLTIAFPAVRKSHSQLTVLCSRPSGCLGSSLSLRTRVYTFPSEPAMSSSSPSASDRSQDKSSVVRWEVNPAPPRVVMSRFPLNRTVLLGRMLRPEYEEPPRTRSSEEVQFVGDHGLYH